MSNAHNIHAYLLPLLLCSLATTGCVTQDAPVIIVQPAATPASPSSTPSPAGFTPFTPPSPLAANPAQSAPAAALTTPAAAPTAPAAAPTAPAAGTAAAAPVVPPVPEPKDPTSSLAQTPFSSATVVIPVTGKVVYRLPGAPGEPEQYILVDSDRPPVAQE